MSHNQNHHGQSPLSQLGLVSYISPPPVDYMHLVCLCVMRLLTTGIWIKGLLHIRFGCRVTKELSEILSICGQYLQYIFGRRGRSLFELDWWKPQNIRQSFYILVLWHCKEKSDIVYGNFLQLYVAVAFAP